MLPEPRTEVLDPPGRCRQAWENRRNDDRLADIRLVDRHQIPPGMKLPVAEYVGDAVQRAGRCPGGEAAGENVFPMQRATPVPDDFIDVVAVFEPRLLVGYDLAAWGGTVTPFFGVGYRYLENNMGGTISTTGAGGYDRISQYVYSPVGFEWFMPLQGEWTGVYALEFDIFWDGTQKSELSDVAVGLSDLTNDQNDGFGFRSSLRFAGQALGYSIEIEPFFRYWLVRDSDVSPIRYQGVAVGYGLEPENQTFEAGAKILLKY